MVEFVIINLTVRKTRVCKNKYYALRGTAFILVKQSKTVEILRWLLTEIFMVLFFFFFCCWPF